VKYNTKIAVFIRVLNREVSKGKSFISCFVPWWTEYDYLGFVYVDFKAYGFREIKQYINVLLKAFWSEGK
jgi:hypothetical protein